MGLHRTRARLLMLGVAILFSNTVLASHAGATSIDVRFTATDGGGITGSNTIGAEPGDILTAMVSISADALGVSSYGVSLMFDMDFGNELALISATELMPDLLSNFNPDCASTQDSSGAMVGEVNFCEASTLADGPVNQTFDIIQLIFQATANVATDGDDIQTGNFAPGFDGVFDNASDPVIPTYGAAAVNLLPEPNTGLLICVGLVAALRSRRREIRG